MSKANRYHITQTIYGGDLGSIWKYFLDYFWSSTDWLHFQIQTHPKVCSQCAQQWSVQSTGNAKAKGFVIYFEFCQAPEARQRKWNITLGNYCYFTEILRGHALLYFFFLFSYNHDFSRNLNKTKVVFSWSRLYLNCITRKQLFISRSWENKKEKNIYNNAWLLRISLLFR